MASSEPQLSVVVGQATAWDLVELFVKATELAAEKQTPFIVETVMGPGSDIRYWSDTNATAFYNARIRLKRIQRSATDHRRRRYSYKTERVELDLWNDDDDEMISLSAESSNRIRNPVWERKEAYNNFPFVADYPTHGDLVAEIKQGSELSGDYRIIAEITENEMPTGVAADRIDDPLRASELLVARVYIELSRRVLVKAHRFDSGAQLVSDSIWQSALSASHGNKEAAEKFIQQHGQ